MAKLPQVIKDNYATKQDPLEDLCDTLITEEPYAALFGDEQQVFHDWVFRNAENYADSSGVDWVGAFYDWKEGV